MKPLSILFVLFTLVKLSYAQDTLFVYGPGGPQAPMEECAHLFSVKYSIPVKVIAGPETKWIEDALQKADLIFGGAEYMLTQFAMQHPGFIDSTTRAELYKRAEGIKILDVNGAGQLGMWEDIAGKQNLIGPIQQNIARSFANTAQAIDAWKTDRTYDAWIIYASWHYRLKQHTTLIKIPPAQTVYRGTPIAVTTITDQKAAALKFVRYLKTNEAHRVFHKWGWE